ncbi:hypothetical protein SAMN05216480_1209 [Pustulibacterium marinum]|uniref:Uncharacterized protein n=2 Tax=Pustulibacterium marinum TaxID=1224947 RepID=A0A1I7IRB3_9FLAO|nr:hypothetical protein SAMN05216480_1209 [Pustulibacterium marinum]
MRKEDAEKYNYTNMSIKRVTVQHFAEFCKGLKQTRSEVLQAMIYFFEGYKLSPYDTLDSHLERIENTFKKRFSAMISIIKDIEKKKMDPTHEMLQLLFQEATRWEEPKSELKLEKGSDPSDHTKPKKELLLEKIRPEESSSLDRNLDAQAYYQDQYFEEQKRVRELTRMLEKIFAASSYVDPTFGSGYVKISMEKNEFEHMKMKAYVHHDHTTENREQLPAKRFGFCCLFGKRK